MRRLSLLVVLLALPAMGQGILYRPGGGACGVNMTCTAEAFVGTSGTGPVFAVSSQMLCAVDLGPGAADCIGTDGSGYIHFSDSAVVDVGNTRIQSSQVRVVGGYVTLENSAVRRLDGSPSPMEGGIRLDLITLGTCSAGVEGSLRGDGASGVSTGHATRLCWCASDGAGTYAWRNAITGNGGTATTCPD